MIRVLHVVENFNGQAVESWLSRLVVHPDFDREQLRFDFFLQGPAPGRDADAMIERGCEIHEGNRSGYASLPQMAAALRRVVKSGNYDVVHIHQDVVAGVFAVWLADLGVPIVTHAHNCLQQLPVGGKFKQKALTYLAKSVARLRSSAVVGVSEQALTGMVNGHRGSNPRATVIYCSAKLDTAHEAAAGNVGTISASARRELHIPPDAKVLLYLGRLDEYKNPLFALEVLEELGQRGSEAYLLVAGTGVLADSLAAIAEERGLAEYLRMPGWVADPSSLLMASDLLLVPSSETCGEGLGLVAVEAQAHGLPVLSSLSIPEDASIGAGLLFRKSLSAGSAAWAEQAEELLKGERLDFSVAMKAYLDSPFTTHHSLREMGNLYREIV